MEQLADDAENRLIGLIAAGLFIGQHEGCFFSELRVLVGHFAGDAGDFVDVGKAHDEFWHVALAHFGQLFQVHGADGGGG